MGFQCTLSAVSNTRDFYRCRTNIKLIATNVGTVPRNYHTSLSHIHRVRWRERQLLNQERNSSKLYCWWHRWRCPSNIVRADFRKQRIRELDLKARNGFARLDKQHRRRIVPFNSTTPAAITYEAPRRPYMLRVPHKAVVHLKMARSMPSS